MTAIRALGGFLYDFVVGDDWRIGAGIGAVLGGTALLVHLGVPAWWLPPGGVLAVLALAVRRGIR